MVGQAKRLRRFASTLLLAAGCGGTTKSGVPNAAPSPIDLDALGCSSGQSGEPDDQPCTVDFGCGYVISCEGAVDGRRTCDCVADGRVTGRIIADVAVCGSSGVASIVDMSRTKQLPVALTSATEECGWSYRCCKCRTKPTNPLYGIDPCP